MVTKIETNKTQVDIKISLMFYVFIIIIIYKSNCAKFNF